MLPIEQTERLDQTSGAAARTDCRRASATGVAVAEDADSVEDRTASGGSSLDRAGPCSCHSCHPYATPGRPAGDGGSRKGAAHMRRERETAEEGRRRLPSSRWQDLCLGASVVACCPYRSTSRGRPRVPSRTRASSPSIAWCAADARVDAATWGEDG